MKGMPISQLGLTIPSGPGIPNTGILVFFFRYSNTGIDIKIPVFGTDLKNNCLRFIHIKVIKSTTINH
jgi:hypothetical protein